MSAAVHAEPDGHLLDRLGTLLDAVDPVPPEVAKSARQAVATRPRRPVQIATCHDLNPLADDAGVDAPTSLVDELHFAVALLRSERPLAHGYRKRLADALERYADYEATYLACRTHTAPPPEPGPGDATHLALQVAAALVPASKKAKR
jgi:hypothetical protein